MKKFLLAFFFTFFIFNVYSQTIVSTTPENKKVILEEFTGVNCGFCPDGHAIARQIKEDNPDDFFVLNVHVGFFADPNPGQPDFRTPFGSAIDAQADVSGYPAGTINREFFPSLAQDGGTAMGRGAWASAANQILAQSSYVNVGLEAEIDVNTRVLTVDVETYYTGNSPNSTNKLNIALLQNNTFGPQSGGGMGSNYPHMHRLVHFLTGQWGTDITSTTQGSFQSQTFTYTIPNDYNGIPADLFTGEFEVIAYVAEGTQKIISGNGIYANYTGLSNNNDANLKSIAEIGDLCDSNIAPRIEIQNLGNNDITSLDIQYSVNGETPQVYNWTGEIPALFTQEVELPPVSFNLQSVNQLDVSIPSDEDLSNNSDNLNFDSADIHETTSVNLSLTLDDYPNETTWGILNSAGAIVQQGGNYTSANQTIQATINLPADDCYTFVILDSYGDGICCQWGNGSYSLTSSDGTVIISGGDFNSREEKIFSNYNTLSTDTFKIEDFKLFPNPSSGTINIIGNNSFSFEIFNFEGRSVANGKSEEISTTLNLSSLSSGVYLVKINVEGKSITKKLILK